MVTITLRTKNLADQGAIYGYWYAGSTYSASTPNPPPFNYIRNRQNLQFSTVVGTGGTPEPLLPGEKIGVALFTDGELDYHNVGIGGSQQIFVGNVGGTATGTVRLEIYRADTKALIAVGTTNVNVNTLATSPAFTTLLQKFPNNNYQPNVGGVILVAHFLTGGTGTLQVATTGNATPRPIDGQMGKQSTGGAWTTQTNKQVAHKLNAVIRKAKQFMVSVSSMHTNLRQPETTSTSGWLANTYMNFKGITIPMGATINSAVLVFRYGQNVTASMTTPASAWAGYLKAVDDKSFSLPSPSVVSYTNHSGNSVYSKVMNRSAGVPFLKKTATPTQESTKSFTVPGNTSNTNYQYSTNEKSIDVKDIVQNLVNKFAYANDSMFFQMGAKPGANNGNSEVTLRMEPYSKMVSIRNKQIKNSLGQIPSGIPNYAVQAAGLGPETAATSQGSSIFIPKLVIDFTAVSPATDFPFTTDAELRLFPFLRSCTKTDAILQSTTPPPTGNNDVQTAIILYLTTNGDTDGFGLLDGVINLENGRRYKQGEIKNNLGAMNQDHVIEGNPYDPPLPYPGGAYNFKKTVWHLV